MALFSAHGSFSFKVAFVSDKDKWHVFSVFHSENLLANFIEVLKLVLLVIVVADTGGDEDADGEDDAEDDSDDPRDFLLSS